MKSSSAFFKKANKRTSLILPIMSFLGLMIFLYGLFKYIEVFSDMKDIEEDNKGELDKMLQKTIGGFAELVIKTNLPLAMLAGASLLQFLPQRENRIYWMAQFGVTSTVLLNEVSAEYTVAERAQDDYERVYQKLAEIISNSAGRLTIELNQEETKAIIEASIGSDDFGVLVTMAVNRKDILSYETLVEYYLSNVNNYMTQIKGVMSRLLWKQFSLEQFKDFCEPVIKACRGNRRCTTTLWEENAQVDDKAVTFQTLILQNDATIFGYLLDQGLLTSHTIFSDGNSLVHMGVEKSEFLKKLLETMEDNTLDINRKNNAGYTPLMLAYRKGQADSFNQLINHEKIKFGTQDSKGRTILHYLVEQKTDVPFAIGGENNRFFKRDQITLNTVLAKATKPELAIKDNESETVLTLAIKAKDDEFVGMLTDCEKIDINLADRLGNTPAMLAFQHDSPHIEKIVTSEKFDVRKENHQGETVADYCIMYFFDNDYVLPEQNDANLLQGENVFAVRDDRRVVVNRLFPEKIANGVNFSNPLLTAIKKGKVNAFEYLVTYRPTYVTREDTDGLTVYHYASESMYPYSYVKILCEQRAKLLANFPNNIEDEPWLDENNNSLTPLEYLLMDARVETLALLPEPVLKSNKLNNGCPRDVVKLLYDIFFGERRFYNHINAFKDKRFLEFSPEQITDWKQRLETLYRRLETQNSDNDASDDKKESPTNWWEYIKKTMADVAPWIEWKCHIDTLVLIEPSLEGEPPISSARYLSTRTIYLSCEKGKYYSLVNDAESGQHRVAEGVLNPRFLDAKTKRVFAKICADWKNKDYEVTKEDQDVLIKAISKIEKCRLQLAFLLWVTHPQVLGHWINEDRIMGAISAVAAIFIPQIWSYITTLIKERLRGLSEQARNRINEAIPDGHHSLVTVLKLNPAEPPITDDGILAYLKAYRFQCNSFIVIDYGEQGREPNEHNNYGFYFKAANAQVTLLQPLNLQELRDCVIEFQAGKWPQLGTNNPISKRVTRELYDLFFQGIQADAAFHEALGINALCALLDDENILNKSSFRQAVVTRLKASKNTFLLAYYRENYQGHKGFPPLNESKAGVIKKIMTSNVTKAIAVGSIGVGGYLTYSGFFAQPPVNMVEVLTRTLEPEERVASLLLDCGQ